MMTGRAQAQSNAAAPAGGSVLQRKCACGQHAMGGECGDCRKKRSEGVVQPKLSVGAADGEFEAQADRVADTVMSGRSVAPPRVTPLGANVPGYGVPERISTNLASLEGAGHALAERERSWFEPRFGRSFGDVRLHTHANAATMAGDLNARAFTFGRNIVFRAGEYSPGSTAGRRLLAHELTHVVQQGAASSSGLVQRSLYSDIKEKAYSGVISGVRKAKNSAMNGLRAMVPKLRPSLQNAALTMIYIAETCIEIVLAVIFGVIGIVVGFGEGIVDMVRGLGTLAYGVIKLQYDLVKGIFVGFEDFDADIDAPDLGNAPPDAHHMQPRYLNGEDAVYNLSGLETDLHHRGHVLLDNQSSMLNTPEWLACAPISGSLRYHPLGQQYYISGEK
jgi:hypothetical protein